MPTRDTLSQQTAPSHRFEWSYERKPARDRGGFLSHLVPPSVHFTQAGLEESGASLRVTAAHSCPTFPGLLAPAQWFPSGSLRVTSRRGKPSPPPRSREKPRRHAGVFGAHAAARAPRLESLVGPSRDADAPCAGIAQQHTSASSSPGALQRVDGGDTISDTTNISFARTASRLPFHEVWSTPRRAPRWRGRANRQGGSILTSRSGSVLASA